MNSLKKITTKESQNLFDLMQNDALNAIAFHSFTRGFHTVAKNRNSPEQFPKLNYMFYVLPIIYNHLSMMTFLNSQELYTALVKEPSIILGLQERANKMSSKTFDGLNLAFSKKVLSIDKSNNTIILLRPFAGRNLQLDISMNNNSNSVKRIQSSAHRLGAIFAKRNDRNIQMDLNIRF